MRARKLALVATAWLLLLAPAGASAASPSTSVVWDNGRWDIHADDQRRLFLPPSATVTVSGTASAVTFDMEEAGDERSLTFAAPAGRTLQAGKHYVRVQKAGAADPGMPGVDLTFDGLGCEDPTGSFEVRDLATAADGRVQRAWIVFEILCRGGGGGAATGEARFGMPAPPAGSLAIVPAAVRFGADDVGRFWPTRTAWVVGDDAAARARISLGGAFFASGCYVRSTEPPRTCRLDVSFSRTRPGTHRSTLRVTDASTGAQHDAEVAGFSFGGTTRFVASSEHPYEHVGRGEDYESGTEEAGFYPSEVSPHLVELRMTAPSSRQAWDMHIRVPRSQVLTPGRTYTDVGPFNPVYDGWESTGMDVNGIGYTCGGAAAGWFEVHELRFDGFGELRSLDVAFGQRCRPSPWWLYGRMQFRAGDTTPLAPWMKLDPTVQADPRAVPAETTITDGPSGPTVDTTPTFAFSTDRAVTFECRVDGATFAPCASPVTTDALADGAHTFDVRTVIADGATDPTPARRSFTVDTTPPDTSIAEGPSGLTKDATPTFTFDAEPGASFDCRVDREPFAPCARVHTSRALDDGAHRLDVRARDAAGNVDPTPASRTFTLDARAPETSIAGGPPSAALTFTADEPGVTFTCRLGIEPWAPCSSPATIAAQPPGERLVAVRATDAAGNVDPEPAEWRWTVAGRADDPDEAGGSGGPAPRSPGTTTTGTTTSASATPPADGPASAPTSPFVPATAGFVRRSSTASAPAFVVEGRRGVRTARLSAGDVFTLPGVRAQCPSAGRSCVLSVEVRRGDALLGTARLSLRDGTSSAVRLRAGAATARAVRRARRGVVLRLTATLRSGTRDARHATSVRLVAAGRP